MVRAFSEALDTIDGKFDIDDIPIYSGEQEVDDLPCFNAFISHKRSDAQDFARTIFSMLKGKDYSCFLDVDALEGVNDLDMLVAGSDVFIFILSTDVLASQWCSKELAAAVISDVPILMIRKEGQDGH